MPQLYILKEIGEQSTMVTGMDNLGVGQHKVMEVPIKSLLRIAHLPFEEPVVQYLTDIDKTRV